MIFDVVTNKLFKALLDGTAKVGKAKDSEKLGGKGASEYALDTDLANYLPLNGSKPMTTQMFKIANGHGAVSASEGHVAICSFENSNYEGTADVLVMFNSRWGNRGIYYRQQVDDVPTDYPILHSGNVGRYALPVNGGGTVTSTAGSSVINVNNDSPDTSMTQIGFQMKGETYGFLGFSAFGVPTVHIPGVNLYPLHHDGNSAKVVFTQYSTTAPAADALWAHL